jgi:hypothetical protein
LLSKGTPKASLTFGEPSLTITSVKRNDRTKEANEMRKFDKLNKEQLEQMVDTLTDLVLEFVDAQTAERLLRANGFETEELEAIGFDQEV